MSQRILRSNRKVLPDEQVNTVKKSKTILLLTSGDSNTPDESENKDEVPKKKIKKRRIRQTQNSFHIDESKNEATLNKLCTESSNTKMIKKIKKRVTSSFIFDSSSDNDAAAQDVVVSSTKTCKKKNNLKLPSIELNDFQQSEQSINKVGQEFRNYKGFQNSDNIPKDLPGVHKKIKQNFKHVKNETSKQKMPATLISSDAKKTSQNYTTTKNIERVESVHGSYEEEENKENFSTSPIRETKHFLSSSRMSNYKNNCSTSSVAVCSHKDELIYNKSKSSYSCPGISNTSINKCSTSEESHFKNKQEKKRIRYSSSERNANYISEMKTSPEKLRFSNDRYEALMSVNFQSSASKTNGDSELISKHMDSSSDSEIEFNWCTKDPLQSISEFPLTEPNTEISTKKEDSLDISMKKILVQTKFDYNTDNKRPNLSMSVATMNCGVNCLENSGINSLSKQNNDGVPSNVDKRGRKRWTILNGTAARRSFQVQIENLRKSLQKPQKEQVTPEDKLSKPRMSLRKRWSDELRKSRSALDISINSKLDFNSEKDSAAGWTLFNQEEKCPIKSRRSRSLSKNTNDISSHESPKTTPHVRNTKPDVSINFSSNSSQNSSKTSKSYKTTSYIRKSKYHLPPDDASSDSKTQIEGGDRSEMEYVDDIGLVRTSTVRRSRSLSNNSNDISTHESPKTKSHVSYTKPDLSIKTLSYPSQNSPKTFKTYKRTPQIRKSKSHSTLDATSDSEIQIEGDPSEMEYVDNIGLVRTSTVRRSRSLSNNSNDISTHESPKTTSHVSYTKPDLSIKYLSYPSQNSPKTFKTYKTTPQIRKSKSHSTLDATSDSEIQIEGDPSEMEYVDNIGLERTSTVRRSRYLSNNSNDISTHESLKTTSHVPYTKPDLSVKYLSYPSQSSPKTFKTYKSTPKIRKSKSHSTLDDATSDSEIQMVPSEMEYVDNIGLVRTSTVRRSRSLSDNTIDILSDESPKTTQHVRNSKPDVSIKYLSNLSQTSSKIRNLDSQNDVNDNDFLKSNAVKQSSNVPGSCSVPDILDSPQIKKTTPQVRKSDVTFDEAASISEIQIEDDDTFEMKYVDDIGLVRASTVRRSRSLSDALNNTSAHESLMTPPPVRNPNVDISIQDLSNLSQKSSERTFEIQKNENDISLLKSTAMKPSLSVCISSSVIDNSDNLSMKKTSRSYRATPHVRKSKPDTTINSARNDLKIKIKENTFVMEDFDGNGAASTSTLRRSTSLTDDLDISTRPSTSTKTNPGAILKRRDTYEINESVINIDALKSLSESTMTEIGVGVLANDSSINFNASKKVRFENVTTRRIFKRFDNELEEGDVHNTLKNKVKAVSKQASVKKSLNTNRSTRFDQTFFSSPFTSSTPKVSSHKPTSQKSFNKDMENTVHGRRRSKSADEGNIRITRIRMPNFAKIHERARDKMENILQLTERKAERAKLLLSGQKPTDSQIYFNNDNNEESIKYSRKQLISDKNQPSTSKGFQRVVHKDTPKKEQLNKELVVTDKNNQLARSNKIPIYNEMKPESRTGFLKVAVPEKLRIGRKLIPPKTIGPNKISHFGFKIKNDAGTENKAEQIKAVATKSKLQQDNRAEQRTILKGVRGNRRFELLMKMRKN